MISPLPRSTLFPYTTLFRSWSGFFSSFEIDLGSYVWPVGRSLSIIQFQSPLHPIWAAFYFVKDRKSTRLNSSHVAISYAVFCLKKKNTNKKQIRTTVKTKLE